jgi:hypothetical protein
MFKQWNSKSPVEWLSNEIESSFVRYTKGELTFDEVLSKLKEYKEYAEEFQKDQSIEFLNVVSDNHFSCCNQIENAYFYKSESDGYKLRKAEELWEMYKSKQLL